MTDNTSTRTCPSAQGGSTVSKERLYGLPDDEELFFDVAEVWERKVEPSIEHDQGGSCVIEEWTVHPPDHHLPRAEHIVDSVIEWGHENGEVDEMWTTPDAAEPELLRAAEALRQAIAARIPYRMANAKVADHMLAWAPGEESQPLLNGEPMYRQRA